MTKHTDKIDTPQTGAIARIGTGRKVWTVDSVRDEQVTLTSIVPTGPRKGYRQMRIVNVAEIRLA